MQNRLHRDVARVLAVILVLCAGSHVAAQSNLAVIVVDAESGRPLREAQVEVMADGRPTAHETGPWGRVLVPITQTEFQFGIVLTARAEGHAAMMRQWILRAGLGRNVETLPDEYVVRLPKALPIGGQVVGGDGAPIPGVRVSATVLPAPGHDLMPVEAAEPAVTGENGRWVAQAPRRSGGIRLRLQAPGQTSYQSRDYGASNAHALDALYAQNDVIILAPRVTVAGRVTAPDGSPVAGAKVMYWHQSEAAERFLHAYSDADGRFEVPNARNGDGTLLVHHPAHAPYMQALTLGPEPAPLDLALSPGSAVHGRVVSPGGQPIDGVQFTLQGWAGHSNLGVVISTGPDGAFRWDHAPDGELTFNMTKRGYVPIENLALSAAGSPYALEMDVGLRIDGTVTDAGSGSPVPEFRVVVGMQQPNGPYWIEWMGETGQDGAFSIGLDGSEPPYVLRIEAEGYLPEVSPTYRYGTGVQHFDARLTPGVGVRGRVVDAAGHPVPRALVLLATHAQAVSIENGRAVNMAEAPATESDNAGAFTFDVRPEPGLAVAVADAGYAVTDASPVVELVLAPWARVEGRAYVEDTLAASAAVYAEYTGTTDPRVAFQARVQCGADGTFALDGLPAGPIRVYRPGQPGGGEAVFPAETSTVAQAGTAVHVDLGGGGCTVRGRIVQPGGGAPPGERRRVMLRTDARESVAAAEFDLGPKGQFTVLDVPPGRYRLRAVALERRGGGAFEPVAECERAFTIEHPADAPVDLGELPWGPVIEATPGPPSVAAAPGPAEAGPVAG